MKMTGSRAVSVGAFLAVLPMFVNAGADTAERLGTVSFQTSCAPAVSADFNRGVALLHDFWYEEARPQFERILKADPSCAMAHWGIALSGFHQIWERPGAAVMAKGWHEMQAAEATPAKTQRERAYLAALSDFFRPGADDYSKRIERYATALGKLYADNPQDVDAGAFYALALIAADSDESGVAAERKAMAVLTPLWKKYPDHPGLVHYIIHACDNPAMATDGLAAANQYGEIAPSGPHAVHMPGHIYARLGMWRQDIAVNRASVQASEAAEAHHESGAMDQFHSDDFLLYAYLQSGQDANAKATIAASSAAIAHFESMPDMVSSHYMVGMFPNYRVKLPIFYALEMRDWKAATELQPIKGAPADTQAQVYWARTIGDGHLHQGKQAQSDLAAFDALLEEVKKGSFAYLASGMGSRIRHQEMLAWVAFAQGNTEEAVKQMSAAADLQDKVGQGEVDIPAREMLADILLESGRANEALANYQQALNLSPNRFNGLYGAGKAAEMVGNTAVARNFYVALLKSTDNGTMTARTEVKHAQTFISSASAGTH
ncbi:MAG TPA: tetratricopeptide repeat protein [Steroidobacteraceae bacterium]|jgi:tetratricopeptide (TPR) repeat protein|nr:tetratricopeptide repeat protein [Steroidobacteraceae bacterium]